MKGTGWLIDVYTYQTPSEVTVGKAVFNWEHCNCVILIYIHLITVIFSEHLDLVMIALCDIVHQSL